MRDADNLARTRQLAAWASAARGCVLNHHGQVCPAWVRGELYLYQRAPSAETVPHPESGEPLIRTGLAARRIPGGGPDGEIIGEPKGEINDEITGKIDSEITGRIAGEIDSKITGGITGEIEGTIEGRIELTIGGRIEQLSHPGGRARVRGLDVDLGLVEHLIARHPDVGECAVQLDDAGGVPALRAYVAPTAVTPRALGDTLASVLPEFLLPARTIALPALPRRPDGTIDRAALGAAEPVAMTAAPASELEAIVRRIWAEVLGLPEDAVPLDRGFFDLGANSLLLVRVADRVHAVTGRRLEIADYFRYLTIAALARALAPDHPHGDDLVVARSRSRAAARRSWLSARTPPDAGAGAPVTVELAR